MESNVRPRFGQHVLCAYCGKKFSYDVKPTRISLPYGSISNRVTMASPAREGVAVGTDLKNVTVRPSKRVEGISGSIASRATMRPPPEVRQARVAERLSKGTLLLGRYEVLDELGQGGMGVVYKCFDKTGGVEVAVKGLPPEVSHDPVSMEDIRDNFQLVSDLRHPGIVGIRNLEADPATGDFYLVMDIAPGKSLRRWAKAHQGREHLDTKLKIVEEIAAALDYAHGRRIMHRDIKPENVTIDEDGHAHVLDFGLASQIRSSMSRVSLVMRSQSGTPSYKAPEQWRGLPQNAATDQYSLGVLAYELIAGYLPFDSEDMAILRMSVLSEPVAEIPDVSSHANAALVRALSKNSSERFSCCMDFARALKGAIADRTPDSANVAPKPISVGGGASGDVYAPDRRKIAIAVAVAGGTVLLAAILMRGSGSHADDGRKEADRDPVELALDAFRRDDYQSGYQYAMSTDRTHPKLQCYIGMCYDQQEPRSRGMKIAKDDWTAKTWYEKSAVQGDVRAMTYLGQFHENGRGCNGKDYRTAAEWFKKAAEKDYPEGKANLKRLNDKIRQERDRLGREKREAEERTRREGEERKRKEDESARQKAEAKRLDDLQQRGWVIESDWRGNRKAVWKEGNTLPQYPHWITTAKENTWRIEDGYAKVDPNGKMLSPVAWKPGWMKSQDIKAGDYEGTWLHRRTCSACRGQKNVTSSSICSTCGGRGSISQSQYCASCGGSGRRQTSYRCNGCNGSCRSVSQCSGCGGSGGRVCSNCGGSGRMANPAAVVGGIVNIFGAARGRRGIPTGPSTLPCSSCGGNGRVSCSNCGGRGTVVSTCRVCSGTGQTTGVANCTSCGGSGRTNVPGTCPNCRNGKVYQTRTCQECQGEGTVWR